jgi:hypothetical protein
MRRVELDRLAADDAPPFARAAASKASISASAWATLSPPIRQRSTPSSHNAG